MQLRTRSCAVASILAMIATLTLAAPVSAETSGALAGSPRRAAATLATGGDHTCSLINTGGLKCWGFNFAGQLGLETADDRGDEPDEMGDALPAIDLGTGRTATAITTGDDFVCALLDNGTVKCWGDNLTGQLGRGDTALIGDETDEMGDDLLPVDLGTGRTATAITTGIAHSCAILDTGAVKCWGHNDDGQLGYGDIENRGDDPDEMGDDLPEVDLGIGRTATAITAGGAHTCVLLDDSSAKCWGANNDGQLGTGDTDDRGIGADEMGDDLLALDLGTGRSATAITTGYRHTCALLDDGSAKCWGFNDNGQLGYGDTVDRGNDPGEMGNALPTVALGTGRTAIAITAGDDHTCALLDNGVSKCWGDNVAGQLGYGDVIDRGDGPNEMGDNLPAIDLGPGRTAVALTTGFRHTCALLDNDDVGCWGDNNNGQLGQGDTNPRGDGPNEMGINLSLIDLGTDTNVDPIASTPSQPGAPGAITDADSVIITWAAPSDDGGAPITSYTVEVSTDGVNWSNQTTVATTSATVTGLTTGTTFRFRVIATNSAGDSPPSTAVLVTITTRPDVVCPTTPFHDFSDVDPGSFANADITCVKALGITTGSTPTTFSPGANVTREQMAAFIGRTWRTLGGTCPARAHGFVDVAAGSFAGVDIACMRALGITTGTTPSTYAPGADVNREQMTAFLARLWVALGNTCPTTPHGFTDVAAGSFAAPSISCVKALGITTGTGPTTFSPADPVTREQMAAFIARLVRANAAV